MNYRRQPGIQEDLVLRASDGSDPRMSIAVEESHKSPQTHKLGAALFRRAKFLSKGYNCYKSHPEFGARNDWGFLHAEMHALYNALKKGIDVRGATLFVFRKNARIAKPCAHCQRILRRYGVREVIYSDD